ncbi:cytochrome P450 [Spirillospora sp. CA-294931]|uniref:cytochrome P450 n=1 Tax=Spirillospora sp. CA-294931 TaxID=3240042 RepID=UPI003D8E39B1
MLIVALAVVAVAVSSPWWLPGRVVALRVRLFARLNGDAAIPVPGDLVGVERFKELYSHPAAGGRSEGAALSDLFWYWLSPGPEIHQEHIEAGGRYDAVARATRGFLAVPRREAEELARRCVAAQVGVAGGMRAGGGLVRLRDLMMPIWAAFYYELVFGRPCPPEARELIVANADDVASALTCCGLRHLKLRLRLTAYLSERLGEVRRPLPEGLSPEEQALYLHGAFFTTAVVQTSEAMAHLLLEFARRPDLQDRARADEDDRFLDQMMAETHRLYPLFGIAHRITTADIDLGDGVEIPAGSVLCFNYPEFHRAGFADPGRFDPGRWSERQGSRDANHIPFGVAANRPCPAMRLAPIVMRAAAREILRRYALASSATHTRSLPNRGPCLLIPRDGRTSAARPILVFVRLRDRFEDVWRSLVQLVLGTAMVLDSRRLRLCEHHFSGAETSDALTRPDRRG